MHASRHPITPQLLLLRFLSRSDRPGPQLLIGGTHGGARITRLRRRAGRASKSIDPLPATVGVRRSTGWYLKPCCNLPPHCPPSLVGGWVGGWYKMLSATGDGELLCINAIILNFPLLAHRLPQWVDYLGKESCVSSGLSYVFI